jgi:CAAD domains of cyanobacterial aminoacyl-tRNA synthetase
MDTQQFEYTDVTSTKVDMPPVESSQPGDLAMLPPASNRNDQLNDIGSKISNFFQKLPEYVAKFYSEYKLPVISFVLLVVGVTSLRILFAAIDAINDIPLASPLFELIGISYTAWFTYRYLLKSSTRQELVSEFRSIRQQFLGANATQNQS